MVKKIRGINALLALVLAAAPFFVSVPLAQAAIDTCTWTGATNNDWSNGGNWSGCDNGGVPQAGDSLIFPASASNKIMDNDLALVFRDVTFQPGSGYHVNGNAVELFGFLNLHSDAQINGGLEFSGNNVTPGINAQNGAFILPGTINLDLTGTSTFQVRIGAESSGYSLPQLTGSVDAVTFIGEGSPVKEILLPNTSTFTASDITLENIEVTCQAENCFGVDTNEVIVEGAADEEDDTQLIFDEDGITFDNPITFNSSNAGATEVLSTTPTATLNGDITVTTSGSIGMDAAANNYSMNINGPVNVASGQTLTYSGNARILHNGAVSGPGRIIHSSYYLDMPANNIYTGPTTVESGSLVEARNTNAFGTNAAPTTIESGGSVLLGSNMSENFTISGTGRDSTDNAALIHRVGPRTLSGTITLDGDATIKNMANADSFELTGRLTGTGNPTFLGDVTNGGITLSGSTTNDYSGTTYVNSLYLTLAKTGSAYSIPGRVEVVGDVSTAGVVVSTNQQIADTAYVKLDTAANLARLIIANNMTETVGTVVGDGTIHLNGVFAVLNVGGGNLSGTFDGSIIAVDTAQIYKYGSGTWNFTGDHDPSSPGFADFITVDGTLLANARDTSLQFSTFYLDSMSAVLGGSSVIGPLIVNEGTVSPGNSPGCLFPDGDFDLTSLSTVSIELAGTTACSGYDQIDASGEVFLSDATLDVSRSFDAPVGTVFSIIFGSSINGQFDGLDDGDVITVDGQQFRINYLATSVTLTALTDPASTDGGLADTGSNSLPAFLIATTLLLATVYIGFSPRLHRKRTI